MSGIAERLHDAVRATFTGTSGYPSEEAFQSAFAHALGDCEPELRAVFAPPRHAPRRPPQAAIDDLAQRKKRIILPAEGRDPCVRSAKLDVLWKSGSGPVPVELKYRTLWNADTYGYMFLKDLHRLERITAAGSHARLGEQRFAIFVTTQSVPLLR